MRKEIVEHRTTAGKGQGTREWLDLDSIAHVANDLGRSDDGAGFVPDWRHRQ